MRMGMQMVMRGSISNDITQPFPTAEGHLWAFGPDLFLIFRGSP